MGYFSSNKRSKKAPHEVNLNTDYLVLLCRTLASGIPPVVPDMKAVAL